MKFKILREYEIRFYSELIKRIKEETTDFAINRGNKYKGWTLISEDEYHQRVPAVYTKEGNIEHLQNGSSNMGIRLLTSYSEIVKKCHNKVKIDENYYEVEYGEYPQDVVDIDKQTQLDYDLLNERLRATGKEYTSHDNSYGQSIKLKEVMDEKGNKYVNKNNTWYKVKPVKWIVDEKSNQAMSKYILTGGVSFGDLMPTRYHFEYMLNYTSNIWGYLKALEKELEPSIVLIKVPALPNINPIEPYNPIPKKNPIERYDPPYPGKNPFEPYDPTPWNSPWKVTFEQSDKTEKVKTIGSK